MRALQQFAGLLIAALALTLSGSALQSEPCMGEQCIDGELQDAAPIRIGYTQFAPFSSTDSTGVATGYSIDLLRLLLEPAGFSVVFVPHDNPEQLLESLAAREIDATTILAINPARQQAGRFTTPVQNVGVEIFVPVDGETFETVEALTGHRVGVSRGSQPARLVNGLPGVAAVNYDSSNDLLLPLLRGDVDAVAAPPEMIRSQLKEAGLGHRVRSTGLVLSEVPGAILVDTARADLVEALNARISSTKGSGELSRLYDHWFAPAPAPYTTREMRYLLVAVALACVLVAYAARIHLGVLRRSREALTRAARLEEALNSIDTMVLVMDRDMRVVWWNESYLRHRPWQKKVLKPGVTLEELITTSMRAGKTERTFPLDDAEREAAAQVAQMREGKELIRIDSSADGRVFERRNVLLANGDTAIIAIDITDFAKANAELSAAGHRLEEANQRLEYFNRIAAHDLRAPLRSIKSMTGMIREDVAELGVELDADTIDSFDKVDILTARLGTMIGDLLNFSKPVAEPDPVAFDPIERLRSVLAVVSPPAGYTVSLPDTAPEVLAEPVAFDIVMRNLISNAINHHDRKVGHIRITCGTAWGKAVFEVTDDGPGIPEEHRERVFEPLKTLKSRDEGGGSGLGLSFVERAVRAWDGDIRILDNPEGRGARFRFTVPLAEEAAGAEIDNLVRLATA